MKAIDLCAGAGGMSWGLHLAGFDVLGVERDADACDTHNRHAGPCELGDIDTWCPAASAELTAGGPPCQAFSPAGKRMGFNDPRGLVWTNLIRVAALAGSSAVLMENSAGINTTRSEGEKASSFVRRAFIKAGWHVTTQVLDSADYGVPQHRNRWFLVGFRDPSHLAAFRWPSPTHAPPGSILGLPPYVTVRQALGLTGAFRTGRTDGASGYNGQRFANADAASVTITCGTNPELLSPLDAPAPTVTAGGTSGGGPEPFANREQRDALHRALGQGQRPVDLGRPSRAVTTTRSPDPIDSRIDRPAPCILANMHDESRDPERASRRPLADLQHELSEAGLLDRPATTVQGDERIAVAGHHERQQRGAVRLTIPQLAALQGFPAGWTFTGNKESQHRQVGNACPPAFAMHIGLSIRAALSASARRTA